MSHVLMPEKVDSEMAEAIEQYFNSRVKYKDQTNCDAMKADCWMAMMAYYAMVEVVKKRLSMNKRDGGE